MFITERKSSWADLARRATINCKVSLLGEVIFIYFLEYMCDRCDGVIKGLERVEFFIPVFVRHKERKLKVKPNQERARCESFYRIISDSLGVGPGKSIKRAQEALLKSIQAKEDIIELAVVLTGSGARGDNGGRLEPARDWSV